MHYLVKIIISVFLISSLNAQHISKAIKVQILIESSGLNKEIDEVTAMVLDEVEQKKEYFSVRQFSIFKQNLLKAFNELEMYKIVNNQFIMNYDERSISKVTDWYMSDFGKSIIIIESENGPDQSQLTSISNKLKSNYIDKNRIDLISKINNKINNQKLMLDILITLEYGKYIGISPYLPHKKHINIEQIRKKIKESTPASDFQKLALLSSLYRYRTLSNSKLYKYSEFLKTPEFSWYFQNMIKSLGKLMFQFGKFYGNEIGVSNYGKKTN